MYSTLMIVFLVAVGAAVYPGGKQRLHSECNVFLSFTFFISIRHIASGARFARQAPQPCPGSPADNGCVNARQANVTAFAAALFQYNADCAAIAIPVNVAIALAATAHQNIVDATTAAAAVAADAAVVATTATAQIAYTAALAAEVTAYGAASAACIVAINVALTLSFSCPI